MAEPNQFTIQVNIPEPLKTGVYSNVVNVTATQSGEVMFDFAFVHPNDKVQTTQQGTLVARVIVPTKLGKDIALILNAQLGGKPKKE